MSGHSKWATIKRAKGASDAKRGALFTKLSKNISIAAKQGKDPSMNSSLRTAIDAAKSSNMPKDNIERAILRGAGELPGQIIEEVTYEGYGPSGVAIMLKCATDNTNRTGTFVKTTLNKGGGKLGGPGTVNYLFSQKGVLRVESTDDDTQLAAMDAGADDVIEEEDGLTLYTTPETYQTVLDHMKKTLGEEAITFSELTLKAQTIVDLDESTAASVSTLLETLEENDDVIEVYHNAKL